MGGFGNLVKSVLEVTLVLLGVSNISNASSTVTLAGAFRAIFEFLAHVTQERYMCLYSNMRAKPIYIYIYIYKMVNW